MTGMPAAAEDGIAVALYWSPVDVTDESGFVQTGGAANILLATGYFSGGYRIIPVEMPALVHLQVRAWEMPSGRPLKRHWRIGNDGERLALVGKSPIILNFQATDLGSMTPPVNLALFIQSFCLEPVNPANDCPLAVGSRSTA